MHPVPHQPQYPASPNGNGAADPFAGAESEEGSSLRDYLATVRRHVWLVLALAVVSGGLAALKAYTDPPEYLAGAVIRMADKRQSMTAGLGSAVTQSMGAGTDALLSQIQVLRSRSVIGEVVEQLGLRLHSTTRGFPVGVLREVQVDPALEGGAYRLAFTDEGVSLHSDGQTVSGGYGELLKAGGVQLMVPARPEVDAADLVLIPREHAAEGLLRSLRTERRERTDVIDVQFIAGDPLRAQEVVNAVVEQFQAYNARVAQQEARRRRLFIEDRLAHADSLLRQAQTDLALFRGRERVYSSAERFAARQAGLLELDVQREGLETERQMFRSLQSRLQAAEREGQTAGLQAMVASPAIAENPVIAQLFAQLLQFETARDSLTSGPLRRADRNPDVQRMDALIGSTQTRLASAISSHLESLDARLAALNDLRQRNSASIEALPFSEAEEVRLIARLENLSNMTDALQEEYQKAQIQEAVEGGQVEIVDPALPGVWIGIGRIRTILFGLVFGLMLGGGAAILLENLNTTIRRRDEIEQVLRVPELAVIPQVAPVAGGRNWFPFAGLRRNGKSAANGNGRHNGAGGLPELVVESDLHSLGAEAYRTLRTNLIFSQTAQALRTMVVTSSAPSEGKSFTAANLAATFAQQGLRVLVVDCDLRRARLHKMFRVPREPGLTHLVLGLKEAHEVVRETSVERLSFLPAGTLPPNPAELLGGERMRETLDGLAEMYDLVVLDTPPLLAASDAAILGRIAGGVLLVVRAGQTERDAARLAMQQLRSVGARVIGGVLNDPDSKVGSYGGHYAYEYSRAE